MSEPPRPPMDGGYNPYGGDGSAQSQQTAQWQPQQPPQKKKRSKLVPLLLGSMLIAAVATGGGLYLTGAFSTEIRTETVAYNDADSFTATTGNGVDLAAVSTPAVPAIPQDSPDQPVLVGNKPGLYGGTGDDKACNTDQLVAFLAQDPAKAAAWAQVQGIQADQIPAFVATLTPLLLRVDTAVTNHGFRNGVANPINSVLQAGTAVLVDNHGIPRARCLCGNPLLQGKQFTRTKYAGTAWPTFQANRVVNVQPSPQPVTAFDVVNVTTGQSYQQAVGSSTGTSTVAAPTTTLPTVSAGPTTSPSRTSTRNPARTTQAPVQQQQPRPQQTQPQQAQPQQAQPQPDPRPQQGGAQTPAPAPASSAPSSGGKCTYPGPNGGVARANPGDSFQVGGRSYTMGDDCTPREA